MDAAALLSPTAVANAVGGTSAGAPNAKAGSDAFASHFSEAMGKAAPVVSPVGATMARLVPTLPISATLPVTGVAPLGAVASASAVGTTATDAPAKPGGSVKASVRTVGRKVDAAPDPPPTEPIPEKGATTKAPIAPVERPDPTSEDKASPDKAATDPSGGANSTGVLGASTVLLASIPTPSLDVKAMPTSPVPVATVSDPSASSILPLRKGDSEMDLSETKEAVPPTLALASPASNEPASETLPTRSSNAGSAHAAPTAPDLGVVPQVVQVASVGVAPASRTVRNAQVAAVESDRPAGRAAEAPAESDDPTEVASNVLPIEAAAKADGDDAPPEDAPKEDATQDPALSVSAVPTARTAATERPEAGTSRPDVDRHLVVRQVADRIESLVASRPKDGVTIHLEPRDLGTITLVVKGLQSALDVKVTASDDRVRQGLDASRPELAQALAPRGIELKTLSVSTAASSSSTAANPNGGGNAGANPEGRPRPQTASPTLGKPSRAETTPARTARSTDRKVDFLV